MPQPIADKNPIVRSSYWFFNAITEGSNHFPLNIFFGLQSFAACQWVSDFAGGLI
jgi:hypothetical protein